MGGGAVAPAMLPGPAAMDSVKGLQWEQMTLLLVD